MGNQTFRSENDAIANHRTQALVMNRCPIRPGAGLLQWPIRPVTQQKPTHICLQAPIIAYVGRLAAQKGMDVLLSALPALLHSRASSQGVHPSLRHCAAPIVDWRLLRRTCLVRSPCQS